MAREISSGVPYANEDTLSAAGTAQLIDNGAVGHTFDTPVDFVTITYASLACYVAPTQATVEAAADGTGNSRVYIPAGAQNVLLAWYGQDVWFLNATGVEQPFVAVVGNT